MSDNFLTREQIEALGMAYRDVVQMAQSQSLLERVAACAASEGVDQPREWAINSAWQLAASPGWADSWASARISATINNNPDMGERDDVITDAVILAAVQARLAANPVV